MNHTTTIHAGTGSVRLAIRALLLDHDGTLVDSYEGIAKCMRLTCRDLGVREVSEAEILASIGPTIEERFAELWGEEAAAAAVRLYRAHYEAHNIAGTRVVPGARRTLQALARRGIRMACVSNKARVFCERQLAHAGLLPYIETVLGHRQGYAPKPDPEMLFAALEALGAPPEEALMVGDTATDIRAARNAAIPVWIVRGKYAQPDEIRRWRPDKYLEKIDDILRFV